MITLLTSELNRINQGCGKNFLKKIMTITGKDSGLSESILCSKYDLCPDCQEKKKKGITNSQQEINKDKINVPLEKDKSISSIQKLAPNDTLIQKLTSELNRINQEIKTIKENNRNGGFLQDGTYLFLEKETLKKVSLMWADEMLNLFDDWDCLDEAKEMKEIKSLMERGGEMTKVKLNLKKSNTKIKMEDNISLCKSCYCMTKTIKGKCGKCGDEK